ncbi:Nn.00g103040.m01.CDS01 [Neocucurbitaria sp. VM-36]
MASKSSSPGPNPTTMLPTKQARSRKAANPAKTVDGDPGRAGSAGGIVLEKEQRAKKNTKGSTEKLSTKPLPDPVAKDAAPEAGSTVNKPRRKPRKLNKEPISTSTTESKTEPSSELEAIKSRVRGLEAKVEELYKTGTDARPARSPRRRGKGRKGSSSTQVPTVPTNTASNAAKVQEIEDDEEQEEADEELVRLEGELEVARQDLEAYRPRNRRAISQDDDDDDVEEIPREGDGMEDNESASSRHVTLSGSYRIPLPTNVSLDDVKTIQSGVSAAQNVARGFLEQRRAAAALREQQSPMPKASTPQASSTPKRPKPRAVSSSMEVAVDNSTGKQSWSEWIGGYSVAISRAVNKIEHEAAMESQNIGSASAGKRPTQTNRTASAPTSKKSTGGKRSAPKAKLNSEIQGLIS